VDQLDVIFVKKKNSFSLSRKIKLIISQEKKLGLFSSSRLKKFKLKILNHINKMQKLVTDLKNKKNRISIYGASGKGQALMQYCKINKNMIDSVFDKSRLKQGSYTPGTYIKIKNPKSINKSKKNYLLILSWNIKNEIMKQEKDFSKKGGKFIIPFPLPRVIR